MMDILMYETCWAHKKWNKIARDKPCFSLQHGYHSNPTTLKHQRTSNQEKYDQCGNSIEQSQAPDDGYINVWNM